MSNPGPASTVSTTSQNLASNQALRLLGKATNVNLNAVADTVIPLICVDTCSVSNVIVTNASASLAQAVAGLYSAPSAGGTTVVTAAARSSCTGPTIVDQMTVASTATLTGKNLYFRCTTVNTAAATCDVYIYGYDFA